MTRVAAPLDHRGTEHDLEDEISWVANDRRLHELVARLEAIGVAALETDPRSQRRSGGRRQAKKA